MKSPHEMAAKLIALGCLLFGWCGHGVAQGPDDKDRPNLLANGSFEKAMEGWDFDCFHKVGSAGIDSRERHDGHPSLRITNTEADDSHAVQTITVKPGVRYRLSGWIKATRIVNEGVGEGPCGASLAILATNTRTEWVSDAHDWTHVSVEFTTDKETEVKIGPRVGFAFKKSTGTAWFADLSLVELEH